MGFWFLWGEYKELQKLKESLNNQQKQFNQAQLAFEKQKNDSEKKLGFARLELENQKKDTVRLLEELKTRELSIQKGLSIERQDYIRKVAEKDKRLDTLITKHEADLEVLKQLHTKYSGEARKVKAEEKIHKLMDEFAALGVDLKRPNWCDPQYMSRYNEANAKLDQILVLNKKFEVGDDYNRYVSNNKRDWISPISDGKCSKSFYGL